MFCSNCGKEIAENEKFCSACGTAVKTSSQSEALQQPAVTSSFDGKEIEYETVQEKKWASPEKILSAIAALVILYTVVGPFFVNLFFGFSGGLGNALRGILIAGVLFGIAMFVHSKRPLTDHYKFKCPYCNEENTVAADEENTFNCSKCKKTMTIVDGKIKTIE